MKHILLSLLFVFHFPIYSQTTSCGVTVDAGEDQELCEPGGEVQLDGEVTGNYLSAFWTGPVDNPNLLNTTANVTETTDFVLEAIVLIDNLITNQDFEDGNTGFDSEYDYVTPSPMALFPEGTYTITDDPSTVHPNFPACNDHTTGSGLFMAINGNTQAGVEVWCQNITTLTNTEYIFSAWATSILSTSPARLQFTINGNTIGNIFDLPPAQCQWNEFNASWNSGGNTSARICITNLNTVGSGNDFGVDDIYFGTSCLVRDTVTIEVLENAEETIDTLICAGSSVEIAGQTLSDPGTYGPFIFDAANGCDSLVTVNLELIELNPVIEQPDFLTCENATVTLSADLSSFNVTPVTYMWSTQGGNIIAGQGTSMLTVDQEGRYFLKLVYSQNGVMCESDEIFVNVTSDYTVPEIDINVNQQDCTVEIWDLTAESNTTILEYEWSTNDGILVPPTNNSTVQAVEEGTYIVTVTNTFNGCSASDTVVLELSSINVEIIGNSELTCSEDTLLLYGNNPNIDYTWTTDTGSIIGNPMNDSILIDKGGMYILNGSSGGCDGSDTVLVEDLTEIPELSLGPDITIGCNSDTITLHADINTSLEYEINWIALSGTILGPTDRDSILTVAAGTYVARLITEGGCEVTDNINISSNADLPDIVFDRIDSLSCIQDTAIIDASSSDNGTDFTYSWSSTNGGNLISPEDSLIIAVNSPGTYTLEITDTTTDCSSILSTEVIRYDTVANIEAGADDTLRCGQNQLMLSANIIDSSGRDSIYWTSVGGAFANGRESLNPVITEAGIYIFHHVDKVSGCTVSDSLQIYIDDNAPFVKLTSDTTLTCSLNQLTLSADGSDTGTNLEVNWTTTDGNIILGETTYEILIDAPGTYTFEILNTNNNCLSQQSVIVTEDTQSPPIDISIPDILNCYSPVDTILLNNLSPDYTYDWSTSDGSILEELNNGIIVESDGLYTIRVSNPQNGCDSVRTVQLEENFDIPDLNLNQMDSLSCENDPLEITANLNSSGSIQIQWTTNDGNILSSTDQEEIRVDMAGVYIILATNTESGCSITDSIQVIDLREKPVLIAGDDRVITCASESVLLELDDWNNSESRNSWFNSSGDLLAENSDTFRVNTPGVYRIVATNPITQCISTDTIRVFEDKEPPNFSILSSEGNTIGCETGETVLSAENNGSSGSYQFLWLNSNGDTLNSNESISIDTSGTYSLVIYNSENGCKSIESIVLNYIENYVVDYDIIHPTCLVEEGFFNLLSITGGNGNPQLRIDGTIVGSDTGMYPLTSGMHNFEISDEFGCTTRGDFDIESPEVFTYDYTPYYEINLGDSVTLEPLNNTDTFDYHFEWFPDETLLCDTCAFPVAFPENSTDYKVTITNSEGCTATSEVRVVVDPSITYYIPNAFSPNQDGTNDFWRPYPGKGIESIRYIRVYSRWGELLYSFEDIKSDANYDGWNGRFKDKFCQPGVYIYDVGFELIKGSDLQVKGDLTIIK